MAERRSTNKRNQSRRRNQRAATDALRLILALILVAVAVVVVIFVKKELGTGFSGGRESSEASAEETEESSGETASEDAEQPGFNRDEEGRLYYLDEDGERLSDTWLSEDEKLYYIDAEGFVQTDDMSSDGMEFEFSEEGEVTSIEYDEHYRPAEQEEEDKEYYSLVKTPRIWVYLDQEERLGSFFLIRYRRTTENTSNALGGDNHQYCSPYGMQIDEEYIYYLPLSSSPEPEDQYINGNLYRMEPGAAARELVAEDVEGYKVLEGDIYYQSGGRIYYTRNAGEDTTLPDFSQVEDFYVDISSGDKAYLCTVDGRRVTLQSKEFKAGNFRYELSAEGEILSVADKSSVNTGGYTYTVEADDAFGTPLSRVVRTSDETGKKEIISSEFEGRCGDLHYDFDSGNIFAEYTDTSGKSRILKITKDGDVDYLLDDGGDAKLELYALQDNNAICRAEGADSVSFISLRLRATVPLALAVEPVEEGEESSEVIDINGSGSSGSGSGLQNVEAPTAQSTDSPVSEGPVSEKPVDTVSGPGAGLPAGGNVPQGELENLSPGAGSVVGGAPPG